MNPSAFDRTAALRRLAETEFDVVVVGGGITGVGCALDAASRGLRTALIERDDFASGTSSKSSKLVHGGLRYLQQGEIRLVYEALAERQVLRRNAPHLVEVLPFLIPILSANGVVSRKLARAMGSAMWMYDLTGGLRIGRVHRRLSKQETLAHFPTLPADRLVSGYLYFDARADDARLCLTVARTAALRFDAVVANGTELRGIEKDASGRVQAVRAWADGREIRIRTTAVVNATGVWADDISAMDHPDRERSIRPAKGVHITLPWHKIRNDIAAVINVPGDRRSVFVVPWGEFTFVGTTDTDYDGPLDDPQCTPEDIEYLLRAINGSVNTEITTHDIVGTWAGLRPLVASPEVSGRTADLSRRHRVQVADSGVVTIAGGKLTTYREMAADTIDAVIDDVLGLDRWERGRRRSRTRRLPLQGAEGHREAARDALAAGLPADFVDHLVGRYGSDSAVVLAMIDQDPGLAKTLVPGLPYVAAEVVYAVRYEMARSVDDILTRRTRARLLARDDSMSAAATVAELMASELDWDDDERQRQVDEYLAMIEAERMAPGLPEVRLADVMSA